ncbi:dockerin type I domain-containing protein [Paenibacillus sp. LS1]|uniref:dockerin type I domain-containing protein n=1 Tax=Paenibacillus sp. LS1 TaxID=2992120 RepID=UPI00223195BC|nr:dockerin type I domain-containing protein [Paenibacillus sp. LS1]MCW3791670.1 dockerin type I domain-containing protein [Paenibacillus sp. LS1]
MKLQTGKRASKRTIWWAMLTSVMMLLATVIAPSHAAYAATIPFSLNQPKDIEFYKTTGGETEMVIADSGNNRVIRATADGKVLSTMEVNHPNAVTVQENGLIYAGESGENAKVHIFNPDGTIHSEITGLISKFDFQQISGVTPKMDIKSMAIAKSNGKEVLYVYHDAYRKFSSSPELQTILGNIYLDGMGYGSGSTGGLLGNVGIERGDNGEAWYSGKGFIMLNGIAILSNASDTFGELAVDVNRKYLYVVVNDTEIQRASYAGASYSSPPVLEKWLSTSAEYPIDDPDAIAMGPNEQLYITDAANNRIIVFNSDGTFDRFLGLSGETNEKPKVGHFSKTVKKGLPISFTSTDFTGNYADADGQELTDVRITSLPESGKMQLNGIDIVQNQVIPVAELGTLTYIPQVAEAGLKTTFSWQAKDGRDFSDTATVTIYLRIKGDANGDGEITPGDALLVNKYIKGLITLTPEQIQALDMNEDGVLDARDSAWIMNIYLGIDQLT